MNKNTWLVLMYAIEEANDRYGIVLFGTVTKSLDGYHLHIRDYKSYLEATYVISFKSLPRLYDPRQYARAYLFPLIRELSKQRERDKRAVQT